VRSIETSADILVDEPLDRETIRNTVSGFLVSCGDTYCDWQGLFPTAELAHAAVTTHYHRRRQQPSGEYHYGSLSTTVVELIDRHWAVCDGRSKLDPLNPGLDKYDPDTCRGDHGPPVFPRSGIDKTVEDLVSRGDRVRLPPDREQKVARVSPSRSLGLPTWSVGYCDLDQNLTHDTLPPRGQNELIARDGEVYCRYGERPLEAPVFEVVGQAAHQATIEAWGGEA
jgi:hypothetical protein